VVDRYGGEVKSLTRFKLLALAMDYTYIENRVAFGLLEEAGIMPLFYKFVEFRINNETQGVYLLVEDPERFYKEAGSEYILRRGYDHRIEDSDYEAADHFIPVDEYEKRYREIYSLLATSSGIELYMELGQRLHIAEYFRKMAIDYLLRNGDYTDEVFLYALKEKDTVRFHPIPWDYDDIFSENPHEVGRSWGMGNVFGPRYYDSQQDIYNDIGDKLIFSIEDDLDYAIAKDPFLYSQYEAELGNLLNIIDKEVVTKVFNETEEELSTFYNSIRVIEQSQYDSDLTTRELWKRNMIEKEELLKERLAQMKIYINSSL
jgi:spore coat protein H